MAYTAADLVLQLQQSFPAQTPNGDNSSATGMTNDENEIASSLIQQFDELIITQDAAATTAEELSYNLNSSAQEASLLPESFPEPEPSQQHVCISSSCAALKVFGTPELLATILGFLDTENVMFMRRINKTWARTVRESPELRIGMFLRTQWLRVPADYMLLNLRIPGLSIHRGEPVDKGRWIVVTMNKSAAREIAQYAQPRSTYSPQTRVGMYVDDADASAPASEAQIAKVNYGQLHITQPPLLGLQVFRISSDGGDALPEGCSRLERDNDDDGYAQQLAPCAKMSCGAGIDMSFVAETALSQLASEDDGEQIVSRQSSRSASRHHRR